MASRRAADELIASGAVRVNGRRAETGALVDPNADLVMVAGRTVKPHAQHRYVVLNKPLGAITTAKDEASRRTVLDVVGTAGTGGHRLFPVGRLDADTTGLLLLTDDGELAYRLTHPRYKVAKEYVAVVAGVPDAKDLQALRDGVRLEDGLTAPAEVAVRRATAGLRDSGHAVVSIVIHEGRHRQVRRMMETVGHRVLSLERRALGPLKLGRLRSGEWRTLSPPEVAALRRAAGLERS